MFTLRHSAFSIRFFVCLLVTLVYSGGLLLEPNDIASAASSTCDFSQMVKADVRLVDGRGGSQYTVAVSDEMREAFSYLHGFGLWQSGSDGAYGDFMTPHDNQTVAWITVTSKDGKTNWLWIAESPSAPARAYAWVFTSLKSTTDSHGEHYGAHQMCATVDVPVERVQALLSRPDEQAAIVQANAG